MRAAENHSPEKLVRSWQGRRAALVIAHPGHELRIHHWVERARPLTFVLTDGSGHTAHSRTASTTAVLRRAGAQPGSIYAAMPDRRLYEAILAGQHEMFAELADELALALRRADIDYVVGDAVEGVNPGHDVVRLVLNAALQRIEAMGAHRIDNMEFLVEGPPDECPAEDRPEAIFLALDDEAYQRKIEAVRAYPELAGEVARVLSTHAESRFRMECLRPVRYGLEIEDRFRHPCVYEVYGQKQVEAGIYGQVIRFQEHIAPIAKHLGSRGTLA